MEIFDKVNEHDDILGKLTCLNSMMKKENMSEV